MADPVNYHWERQQSNAPNGKESYSRPERIPQDPSQQNAGVCRNHPVRPGHLESELRIPDKLPQNEGIVRVLPNLLHLGKRIHCLRAEQEEGALWELVALEGVEPVDRFSQRIPAKFHENRCRPWQYDPNQKYK